MNFYKSNKWHFRNNSIRKKGKKNKGKHPSLIVGETKDNKKFINIGVTHAKYRGHHKNIEIKDPTDWNKFSRIRDDISVTDKDKLKEILNNYKLHPNDVKKVLTLIEKYKKKNSH